MSLRRDFPTDYEGLREFLGNQSRRQLCNNTVVEMHDGCVAIVHHATTILRIRPDSLFITDGGHVTATTYDRIRRFLPDGWRVRRRNRRGYLYPPEWSEVYRNPLAREIAIYPQGVVIPSGEIAG